MSLACLVCHSMESPTHSFRSYSASSSENNGRCAAVASCLAWRETIPSRAANSGTTSKVTPAPVMASGQGIPGAPRLVRSRAVTRDRVRDWNFDEFLEN